MAPTIKQILEAIEVARAKADPHAKMKGWAEIKKHLIEKFEAMSDAELLRYLKQPAAADV